MKHDNHESTELGSALVSVLFTNGDPMNVKDLSKAVGAEAHVVAEELKKMMEGATIVGLQIVRAREEYQLVTDPRNAGFVQKVIKKKEEETLGKGSLEVLSIIAYRSPITKGEIELIRGINSSQALRNLMIKGLIEEEDTRGIVRYHPTVRLLNALGIKKIEDLADYGRFKEDERVKSLLNQAEKEAVDEG